MEDKNRKPDQPGGPTSENQNPYKYQDEYLEQDNRRQPQSTDEQNGELFDKEGRPQQQGKTDFYQGHLDQASREQDRNQRNEQNKEDQRSNSSGVYGDGQTGSQPQDRQRDNNPEGQGSTPNAENRGQGSITNTDDRGRSNMDDRERSWESGHVKEARDKEIGDEMNDEEDDIEDTTGHPDSGNRGSSGGQGGGRLW